MKTSVSLSFDGSPPLLRAAKSNVGAAPTAFWRVPSALQPLCLPHDHPLPLNPGGPLTLPASAYNGMSWKGEMYRPAASSARQSAALSGAAPRAWGPPKVSAPLGARGNDG